jgi:hypothetical protein
VFKPDLYTRESCINRECSEFSGRMKGESQIERRPCLDAQVSGNAIQRSGVEDLSC